MWTCQSQSEGNATAENDRGWTKLLDILHKSQRGQATIAFADEEGMNWHYIPREPRGVPLKVLNRRSAMPPTCC